MRFAYYSLLLVVFTIVESRKFVLKPTLAHKFAFHYNVTPGALVKVFREHRLDVVALTDRLTRKYELEHIATGEQIFYSGFTPLSASQTRCVQHAKTIAEEARDVGRPLKWSHLPCIVHRQRRCSLYEGAQRPYFIPLEHVRLKRDDYAEDAECDAQIASILESVGILNATSL
ncbi:hypothetical protein AAVH_22733 [Aphelenchoides avenae]|nr:hypothetical protein AAVH_22733 [Aphelenchus avenae]